MNCSGRQSRPSAKVLSWGQNACTALTRRPICDGAPRSIPWPRSKKEAGPQGSPPRKSAVKSQFPARAAVMMAMEQLPLNVPFCGDPLGFKCSGRQSRPSAKVLSWGQNACTALQRRPICDGAPRSIPWPRGQNKAGPQWGPAKEGCSKLSVSGQSGGDDGHGTAPAKCSILRGPVGIEMLRAAEPPFRQGFVLGTKRLYGAYARAPSAMGPRGLFHGHGTKTKRAPGVGARQGSLW